MTNQPYFSRPNAILFSILKVLNILVCCMCASVQHLHMAAEIAYYVQFYAKQHLLVLVYVSMFQNMINRMVDKSYKM